MQRRKISLREILYMYKVWVLVVGVLLFAAGVASAVQQVKVIDGDSIVVNGVEMRLEGIDAPEYQQICYDTDKKGYRCGVKAREYLLKLTAGKKVSCKKLSVDRYKRQVSVCYAGGTELNREMVRAGWAVAYDRYSDDYAGEEKEARKYKRGIWQGKFMKPELWRRLND